MFQFLWVRNPGLAQILSWDCSRRPGLWSHLKAWLPGDPLYIHSVIVDRTQSLTPRILLGPVSANSVRAPVQGRTQQMPRLPTWPHNLGSLLLFKQKNNYYSNYSVSSPFSAWFLYVLYIEISSQGVSWHDSWLFPGWAIGTTAKEYSQNGTF